MDWNSSKPAAKQFFFYTLITLSLSSQAELSATDNLWNLSLADLLKVKTTSIATGTQTPLDKAASTVTVISSEDIAAMGAIDLDEILETVPGLHVSRNPLTYTAKYTVRGITSTYTPQTLVLINGIPISSLYVGHPSLVWGGMPVKAIHRVEVIRGPGSALYGADAYAGVINIITKGASDTSNEAGITGGSHNTKAGWVSYANTDSSIDIGFTLEYSETDGFSETVEADAQTLLDSLSGTSASLAPGEVNTGKDALDIRLEVSQPDWMLRLGYQGRRNLESGAGISQALSPSGRWSSDRINTDLSYNFDDLSPDWQVSTRLSYYYADQQVDKDNVLFPAGSNVFYPLGTFPTEPLFPDGVIGNPEYKEHQTRFNLSSQFHGFNRHIISMGAGYFWGDIFEVTEQKNFGDTVLPDGTVLPLTPRPGGLEEVADTAEVFLPEKNRSSVSLYIQDEWRFHNNWALTSGIRYDDYSDFGDTINPRVALVGELTSSITSKLLYGRAFRAPSINELFVTSNPVNLGNPDLEPETIDTYEIALTQNLSDQLNHSANIFYYDINKFISYVLDTGTGAVQSQNSDKITGHGVEYEITYTPFEQLSLIGNYAYQKTEDKNTHEDVGETPNHQVYFRSQWVPLRSWRINAQLNWVGEQKRVAGDNRENVQSYTTLDLNIKKVNLVNNLSLALVAKNILDEKVYEASPPPSIPFPSAFIPNDLPMAGRSLYGELSYSF